MLEKSPTREHVIPDFIYRENKHSIDGEFSGWNEAASKRLPSEQVIRDVCEDCNSGVLSFLDNYGKELLRNHSLLSGDYKKTKIILKYDFDLLLRWLLKLSFNSTRRVNRHSSELASFRKYIMGETEFLASNISMIGIMQKGLIVTNKMLENHDFLKQRYIEGDKYRPFFVRISYAYIEGLNDSNIIRVCMFGSLAIFLIIDIKNRKRGYFKQDVKRFLKSYDKSRELTSRKSLMVLMESDETWAENYIPQMLLEDTLEGN